MSVRKWHLLNLLFASLFVLAAYASNNSDRQTEGTEASPVPAVSNGSFVSRLISVGPGMEARFISHFHDCYLPVWNGLRNEGVVTNVSVFELSHYDSTIANTSAQDYLVLAELGPGAKPDDLLDAEITLACPGRRNIPDFSVLRSAYMSCTPNSCYGMPEPTYPDLATGVDFLVQLIGVADIASALAKYREIVSKYAGPANGILVERGMLHCFVALENIEILSDTPGTVPWNQIHISDDWDVGGDIDWDAVYEELFRNEFSCDQDSVWAELPPTDKTRADYHGRIIPRLCVR